MMRNWRFLAGASIVVAVIAVAGLAPVLAPYEPNKSSVLLLQTPSATHWLGTDELGRDVLSRLIYGARTSLVIGIGAALVALLIGAPIGLVGGYFRGRIDLMIVPVIDLFVAMPALLLALIITVMVGPSHQNLILVLGFVMWPTMARLVRGQALAIREATYIEAAVAAASI